MKIFAFGESHPDFAVKVLNEREARAGAGILLFFGLIAFTTALTSGNFLLTRIAITAFGIDFALRVLVNPRFAPSLVLGRLMVRRQRPDYTGAPQKRFAWGIGLALAVFMALWVIGLNRAGPLAGLGCLACILLLFFETAFGICLGCKLYNLIWPGMAQLCPGGVCEAPAPPEPVQRISAAQLAVLGGALALIALAVPPLARLPAPQMQGPHSAASAGAKDCTVPEFAIAMGHAEIWKQHNGCS